LLKAEWSSLSAAAASTLASIDTTGWESVFGKVEEKAAADKVAALRSAAAAVSVPTKPWSPPE
jgi:hypothetical protein